MRITVIRDGRDARGQSRADTFDLPPMDGASISNALQYINRHLDGTLGYYLTCRRGICVCCVVKANGKIETACMVPVEDGMVIEPIREDLLVKDTVVDLSMAREARFEIGDDTAEEA